jgi:hypothetical protein
MSSIGGSSVDVCVIDGEHKRVHARASDADEARVAEVLGHAPNPRALTTILVTLG